MIKKLNGVFPFKVTLKEAQPFLLPFSGVLATVIVIALIELLANLFRSIIPDPAFFLVLPIVYTAFTGGRLFGFGSASLSIVYLLYFFSPPGKLFELDLHDWLEVGLQALIYPVLVLLISYLRYRNISQARRLEQEVEKRQQSEDTLLIQNNYLMTLHQTTLALLEEADLNDLLETIIKNACTITNTLNVGIFLVDPEQEKMVLTIGSGSFASYIGQGLARGVGLTGFVWDEGKTVVLDDYDKWAGKVAQYKLHPSKVHSIIGIPLKFGTETIGLFELTYEQAERTFTKTEIEYLEQLAELASLTLQNLKLNTKLHTELTAREQVEIKLRESEERFRYALSASGVGAWGYNLPTDEFIWSYGVEWLHSFSEKEVIHNLAQFLEHVWEEDKKIITNLVTEVLANKTDFSLEYRVLWQDGSVHWIQCKGRLFEYTPAGQPALVYGIVQDITGQKLLLEKITESETRFQTFMENSPAVSWVVGQDEQVSYMGHRKLSEQMVGKSISEIYPPDIAPQYVKAIKEVYQTNQSVEIVGKIIRADKSTGLGLSCIFPLHYPTWQRAIGGITLDITETQRLKEALEISQRQFLEAQKLESIGRLASGVAHDFNNILTAMLSYITLMTHSFEKNQLPHQELAELKLTTQRAMKLVRQLLAFSRRQILEAKVFNLNQVITDMLGMLDQLIAKKITVKTLLADNLDLIKADSSQLEQVILNLAINARDAMPEGGNLIIETTNVSFAVNQSANFKAGDYVLLTVSDNGTGMDEETSAHIFEPFFTTKEIGKGTGLGLAAVSGIVEQSGGWIMVSSKVGSGTQFKVYLPKTDEQIVTEVTVPIQHPNLPGTETILLVDDEQNLRNAVSRWLLRNGYKVLEASDGIEALAIFESGTEKIDLVMSDLNMPNLGGTEFYGLLKQRYPTIKLLGTSGYSNDAVSKKGILNNCDGFIEKPFELSNLLRKIRGILGE
jgi:two-component system, cell cycle sensor histidine kinase and response regulator CckA